MKPPSEAKLAEVERKLRTLPRGAQRKVTEGIYMRLERAGGRRRFTYRGLGGLPGGTCDTWAEAHNARAALERRSDLRDDLDPLLMTREQQRRLTFQVYYERVYAPSAVLVLDITTRTDYAARATRDVLPLIGHYTLEELQELPGLMVTFKTELAKRRTFPEGHRRAGKLPAAACNEALKVASAVLEHAVQADVIYRNPLRGVTRFKRPRKQGGQGGSSHRKVYPDELMRPEMMVEVGLGMRGTPVQLLERRAVPVLIVTGFRPQDLGATTWRAVRDERAPTRLITIRVALKDIRGHLITGQPKRGTRTLYQFDAVAEMLDEIYQLRGRPHLDSVMLPNTRGGFQDWGNWRDHVWYKSLHRAGISSEPNPQGQGAFDPYTLRHIGVTTMMACRRHDGADGRCSPAEVARQFAHGTETLHKVYHHVLNDPHHVAGKTMDEIIRDAFRSVWGAMPRDPDYTENLLSLDEAAELTGLTVKSLEGRIRTGWLPVAEPHTVRARSRVSEFDLSWSGLLDRANRQR